MNVIPPRSSSRESLATAVQRASRLALSSSFLRFGAVGVGGLVWDTATVYALRGLIGLYAAGAAGFIVAATLNWIFNRLWTFRGGAHAPPGAQWLKFMVANTIGFIVNRGLFYILITHSPLCYRVPVLAIIGGSIAGLGFNYFLSKTFVFR